MKSVCRILTLLMCTGFLSLSKAEIEWKEIGTSVPDLHPVLTFCIADNQKIYLGMENSFIYRSDNLGEDWIFCSWRDPVPVYESNDIVYLGVDSNGIVWAHAMEPMDCCEDGLWRSADHGMHWERMLENQYNDEWYIAVHSGGDLLYGFHDGISVIKTAGYWSDEGWEHILYYQAQNFGIQSLAINDQKHVFYAMTSYPAYVVDLPDAHYSGNLPNFYAKYTGIDSKDILYSCIDQKLNRSMDFLENWTDITPPEREVEYFCLDHRDYLFAGTDQGIYLSEDHGENWSLLGLQEFHITHISVNASGNIVAGASNGGQLRVFLGVENPAIDFLGVLLPASEGYEIPMLEEFRIRWTHLGNVGNEIKIELYEDHVFKNTIAENTGNDGAFDWMVTRHAAENVNYQFKVTSLEDPTIYAWSPTFKIVKAPGTRVPKSYTAKRVPQAHAPVIDGNPDEAVWDEAEEAQTLDFGGTPGAYNTAWMDTSDANVSWKALWCGETNKLYVALEVRDDVRGAFDNGEGGALYSPANDESIEIMTDGNANGGNFLELFEPAQYWRITAANQVNLVNYPTLGDHPYTEDGIISAVHLGENGNWTCELEMTVYDAYPSAVKTLATGDQIGWELWYNDSDNETDKGSYYAIDHQIGWAYTGPSWKIADFSGDLKLGDYIEMPVPNEYMLTVESEYGSVSGGGVYTEGDAALFSVDSLVTGGNIRHVFAGWSGDYSGSSATGQILMDGPKTVTAAWNTQYLLRTSVQGEEGGTVVPGDSVWVDERETVELTAVPDAEGDYIFSRWTGDIESNANPLIVNMDSPKTIVAVFETATSVQTGNMPLTYNLYQNVPNPFNPSTRIVYDIPEMGLVRLEVFDLMGRKVCTLVNDMRQPGSYQAVWNGLDDRGLQAASGTYVYVMRCGDYQKRMKAVFLK